MIGSSETSVRNRSPFTAIQWQELEQQALIFKYLVSGSPIPPDLIYSVQRSLDSSVSSSSSRLFPFHPIGWGCLEMGYGRKVDPEPGRCRRTDGKKWRCSKEAYLDSKYCERHMHRGKNRSRKPVEISSTAATIGISTNTSHPISSPYSNRGLTMSNPNTPSATSFPFSLFPSDTQPYSHIHQNSSLNPLFYTHSTSSRPPDSDFPSQKSNTHQLFLDSGSYSGDQDYSHIHGMREGVDERAFFPEASGTVRSFPDSYQQLPMSSCKTYSNSQFQNMNDNPIPRQEEEQHCFVLERDFKSPGQIKHDNETEMTQRSSLHQFFGEWPPKNTADSWLDLASNSRIPSGNVLLSIASSSLFIYIILLIYLASFPGQMNDKPHKRTAADKRTYYGWLG